ncbi:MAG: GDP-mannose 4,6-dehydratase [Gemmatimonadaceae bacterium]|nr:GDP-mannose 4,6-dehydratase [Gemmatimonadaceae bacterium]
MKKILLTGIFGQDGSYLAEILTSLGHQVNGVARMPLRAHAARLCEHLGSKGVTPILHECDLNDDESVTALLRHLQPDECYHLAALHRSSEASRQGGEQSESAMYLPNVVSGLNVLEAAATASPHTRIVLAGSCHMYSGAVVSPQFEGLPFAPRSMYGLAKVAVADLARYYREERGLHASVAILYNHESPRRTDDFVTKKIVRGLDRMRRGESAPLELDNLHAVKDWGFARDYAEAMTLMGAQSAPRDLILATGKGRTVGEFVETAAGLAGISDWQERVRVRNPGMPARPPVRLVGDPAAAYGVLGWRHSVSFAELIAHMLECEAQGSLG